MNNLFGFVGGVTYWRLLVNESEPSFFAEEQGVAVLSLEKQRVTAEGKCRTDYTDTAVDLACSRAYFLYTLAMTAVAIIGHYARWRA